MEQGQTVFPKEEKVTRAQIDILTEAKQKLACEIRSDSSYSVVKRIIDKMIERLQR